MAHETPTIEAQPRERTGSRYAQRLRSSGRLPGIIYGHQTDPQAVSVDEKELLTILHHGTHVMKLAVTGGKEETCLVKDLQFGFLGDDVIHVDFTRVNLDEEVRCNVHLHFVGDPKSAAQAGAIMNYDLTELEVICKVSDIPEEIKVDLTPMETNFTVGELQLPPDVRAVASADTSVAHISFVRGTEDVGEEAEVTPGESEPEVITEAKPEEGEATE